MNDIEKLISRLDFTYEGISKAKKYADSNDTEAFANFITEHFKKRTKPYYLFDESDIQDFSDKKVIEEADKICDHFIFGYNIGEEIDWLYNPTADTSKDPEWSWSLFRTGYWVTLGRAYEMTHDEKYAVEFVKQLKSFIKRWPLEKFLEDFEKNSKYVFPGHAWRTIETAMRIYTSWLPCMVYFRKSPSWDTEGWIYFLNSIYDHAEYLYYHYNNHATSSNWLTMECSALFQIGVLFPEFNRAKEWMKLAYKRVTHEVRYSFDHEGVHMERTPIYHLVATGAFLQAYRIARLNNIVVPPYMLPILEKAAEYIMKLVKPDFSTPMIGDADRNSLLDRKSDTSLYEGMNLTIDPHDLNEMRSFFRTMAELTGREDFKYFSTGRKEGTPPKNKNYGLADQGFYITRTGWEEKDNYLMVTGVQLERGERSTHSHYDAGHIELQVEGQDILVDTGRYIYNASIWSDWRKYFRSPAAHNTVFVDEHIMGEVPDTSDRTRGVRTFCHLFESNENYDLIDVSHNGYAFMEEPVFHRRRVIYLKPDIWLVDDIITGYGEHDYKLYFNFAPGELKALKEDSDSYSFVRNRVSVDIMPVLKDTMTSQVLEGSENPKGGWISYGYPVKVPAPQLIYRKNGKAPVRFLTAIMKSGCAEVSSTVDEDQSMIRLNIKGQVSWQLELGYDNIKINKL